MGREAYRFEKEDSTGEEEIEEDMEEAASCAFTFGLMKNPNDSGIPYRL